MLFFFASTCTFKQQQHSMQKKNPSLFFYNFLKTFEKFLIEGRLENILKKLNDCLIETIKVILVKILDTGPFFMYRTKHRIDIYVYIYLCTILCNKSACWKFAVFLKNTDNKCVFVPLCNTTCSEMPFESHKSLRVHILDPL